MTDIDFDELDKAVSSLMGDVDLSKRNSNLDDPEEKVVAIPDTVDENTDPLKAAAELKMPVVKSQEDRSSEKNIASDENQTTKAPLAIKRRGQFMDIVRPTNNAKSVEAPTSRRGVTIAPIANQAPAATTVTETPKSIEDDNESMTSEIAAVETKPMPLVDQNQANPNSLGLHRDEKSETTDTIPDELIDELSPSTTSDSPLVTPFLADAKVEKRPLGSRSLDGSEQQPIVEETKDTKQPDNLETEQSTSPLSSPLPVELGAEMIALDSTSVEELSAPKTATNVEIEPSKPAVIEQPPAGGSIVQQYAEQPSSGDQLNGAIYDTATYHKGVEGPAKKKTSVMIWLIWSLVLLVIGGAVGAGYFFYASGS